MRTELHSCHRGEGFASAVVHGNGTVPLGGPSWVQAACEGGLSAAPAPEAGCEEETPSEPRSPHGAGPAPPPAPCRRPAAAPRLLPAAVAPARGARGRAGRKRKAAGGARQDGGGAAVAAGAAPAGPEPGRGVALSPAGGHGQRQGGGPAEPLSARGARGARAPLPSARPPPPRGPGPGPHHVGHPAAGEGVHPQRGPAMGRQGHRARLVHLRGAPQGDVAAGARRGGR